MMYKSRWVVLNALLLTLLIAAPEMKSTAADTEVAMAEQQILRIIDRYVEAVNGADADLLEGLFWSDDPRFSEVENDRPKPFGRGEFRETINWIREHAKPGEKQRFYDTKVHVLSPEVAYSVSLRDELEVSKTSRVTLVYLKRGDEWRIIHGHFSYVPE